MGKIIIIIFASFSMLFIEDAGAQEAKRFDRAAFEAKRNAYIMAEIGLTPEEAADSFHYVMSTVIRKWRSEKRLEGMSGG